MLGGQMAGGGAGVAVKEELILIHCTLDMEHAVSSALRAFAPLYVETVEKWRKICRDLSEGREESPSAPSAHQRQPGGQPGGQGKPQGGPGGPGQGFIKI